MQRKANSAKPTKLKGLKKGWGVDLSIHDRVVTLTEEGEREVEKFMQGFHERNKEKGITSLPTWNTKNRLSKDQLDELDQFIETLRKTEKNDGSGQLLYIEDVQDSLGQKHVGIRDYPGGSTGNTIYNFGRIIRELGVKDFGFKLLTVIGKGSEKNELAVSAIREEYKNSGIEVIEPEGSKDQIDSHARSIIFVNRNKEKLSLTNSGLAPALINTQTINEEDIVNSDFIFLQSTIMERFSKDFFNTINEIRWANDIPLILALPTSSYRGRGEDNELAKFVIPSADYIVCNNEELINIFHREIKSSILGSSYRPDQAYTEAERAEIEAKANKVIDGLYETNATARAHMDRIAQECLMLHIARGMDNTRSDPKNKNHRNIYPVVFITRGENGATVIDMSKEPGKEKMDIDTIPIPSEKIKSASGAGDAAYSGFLLGRWLNLSPNDSGKLGMEIAAEKLTGGGPRLSEPSISEMVNKVFDLASYAIKGLSSAAKEASKVLWSALPNRDG